MNDGWKFWRYRDEFDALLIGTVIGVLFVLFPIVLLVIL